MSVVGASGRSPLRAGEGDLNRIAIILTGIMICTLLLCSCAKTRKEPARESEPEPPAPPVSQERDDRPLIIAFGNSLTAGAGVDPAQNYPSKLQAKIDASGYRYRVLDAGISGETSSQGLSRVGALSALHPAIVIVELGANDGLRGLPAETTRRNLAAIIGRFQSAGAKVVLAGMEMPPNYGPQYTRAFRDIFPSLAKEYGVSLIPFFLEGVGGHPELNQDDGIHPTARGYDIVVENVWKALKPML
jgi:acyl-CoA thioesterase-1